MPGDSGAVTVGATIGVRVDGPTQPPACPKQTDTTTWSNAMLSGVRGNPIAEGTALALTDPLPIHSVIRPRSIQKNLSRFAS